MIQGVLVDVTQLKDQERAAQRQAISVTDQTGRFQYVNPALLELSGYTWEEVANREVNEFQSRIGSEIKYTEVAEFLEKGEVWKNRISVNTKAGKALELDLTVSSVRDERGKTINYVAIGHDVTEQMELQRQYLQSQKLEAVGAFGRGSGS